MWINAMGERWSVVWIALAAGALTGLVAGGVGVVWQGAETAPVQAIGIACYLSVIVFLIVVCVPGLAAWWVSISAAWTMAKGYQKAEGSEQKAEEQGSEGVGAMTRTVRYNVNGSVGELVLGGPDDLLERAWREQCIALLERAWAWEQANSDQVAKGVTGLTVEALVGKGKALSSAGHWAKLTDVLAFRHSGDGKPGYILKASGQTTMLTHGYTYAGAIGEIANGGPLPHPKTYPPMVRKA